MAATNVNLIDPNGVNTAGNINTNPILDFEEAHIFVELSAIQRERTVLLSSGLGYSMDMKSSNDGTTKIYFLGAQDDAIFTTNWYEGSINDSSKLEGFGISGIKITLNSSFIPQIDIQFVDIRGMNFFNSEKSGYRALFDFPPPIFELTVKGYYGKALTYQIHLVKYTTEFNSGNGNFTIDAQFVAMTFAPLSDILFRYAINFPIMSGGEINADKNAPPANTWDLIKKLENLYSSIDRSQGLTAETVKQNNEQKNITQLNSVLSMIDAFAEDSLINKEGDLKLLSVNAGSATIIDKGLNEYYRSISTTSLDSDIEARVNNIEVNPMNKLHLAYVLPNNDEVNSTFNISSMNPKDMAKYNALNKWRDKMINALKTYSMDFANGIAVKKTAASLVTLVTVGTYTPYEAAMNNEAEVKKTKIASIDISPLVVSIKMEIASLELKIGSHKDQVNSVINAIVLDKLRMKPTIYNIFNILLSDVDTFFNLMRRTVINAEESHQDYRSSIINSGYGDIDDPMKIFAFPLMINSNNKTRKSPLELYDRGVPFPEIDLVKNFIDSFRNMAKQKKLDDIKNEMNGDGDGKWCPFSPYDSGISEFNSNPYSGKNEYNEILDTLIDRFYLISQNAWKDSFYTEDKISEMFGEAEAINLVLGVYEDELISRLINELGSKGTPFDLYKLFIANSNTKYALNDGSDNSNIKLNSFDGSGIFVDRHDGYNKYHGLEFMINNVEPIKRVKTGGLVDEFYDETGKPSNWFKGLTGSYDSEKYVTSNNNILWVKDAEELNESRYVAKRIPLCKISEIEKKYAIAKQGNIVLSDGDSINTDSYIVNNVDDVWVEYLSNDIFITNLNNLTPAAKSIIYLSNFGHTLSPFNQSNNLNKGIFSYPAIITMPKFLPAYIGSLLRFKTDDTGNVLETDELYVELKNFLIKGILSMSKYDTYFASRIFADIRDINKFLSPNDKEQFILKYDDFLYESINNIVAVAIDDATMRTAGKSEREAKNIKREIYSAMVTKDEFKEEMLSRVHLLNYNQITFSTKEDVYVYEPLSQTNANAVKRQFNDKFFKKFLETIKSKLELKLKTVSDELAAYNRSIVDNDIVTQTYYSFKTINDKWIAGLNKGINGFPFNGSSGRLIDSFAFVDRAMNPIGDTIINPESLIEMFDDPNISIFTVISTILSQNGFEFFPLQNFMSYTDQDWEESFKITNTRIDADNKPAFVCMYIGGSSSYPTGIEKYRNQFADDGIIEIDRVDSPDFNGVVEGWNVDNDGQDINGKYKDSYSKVRAFRVRFAEQNQTMFTEMKIDSKEYPETNESIQILARIAGDQGMQAPIPKGQNLYNLYENRSYKSTITSFGNVMIQPTQYFQLENVPMYNGAYVILNVEHDITPNKMMTKFSGTKIAKYPASRVLDSATVFGVSGGGDSGSYSGDYSVYAGSGSGSLPNSAKFNSMHTYKFDGYKPLTEMGMKFIIKECGTGRNNIEGTNKFPLSSSVDEVTGLNVNKKWTSNAYKDGTELSTGLIKLINKSAEVYGLDANIIAATIFIESGYKLWTFPYNSNVGGLIQIKPLTLWSMGINGKGSVLPKISDSDISKLSNGYNKITDSDGKLTLTDGKIRELYSKYGTNPNPVYDLNTIGRKFRGQLQQNMIDNPDVLINVMCRYVKYISGTNGDIVSSTLFGYTAGNSTADTSYKKVIEAYSKGINSAMLEEKAGYVLDVWKLLKNNFGYNELFSDKDSLDKVPNPGFDIFGADVASSAEYSNDGFVQTDIPSISPLNSSSQGHVSSDYGWRNHNGETWHMGIDIGVAIGSPVFATANGKVRLTQLDRGNGYGNYIEIAHKNGIVTRYAHLSKFYVKAEDNVSGGTLIGASGESGSIGAKHLHYEVRIWDEALRIEHETNPNKYLGNAKKLADELEKYSKATPSPNKRLIYE